jgi:HK97 family phage major capsid protein
VVSHETTGTGSPRKYSAIDDTASFFAVNQEAVAAVEVDPTGIANLSNTDQLSTLVLVSRAEIEDSQFSIDNLLNNLIGKRYQRTIEKFVAQGNGSNYAKLAPSVLATTTENPTAPAFQDIVALTSALDPSYLPNAVWSMNQATRAQLFGLVDNFGRPIFTVGGVGAGTTQAQNTFDTLMGKPVIWSNYLPTMIAGGAPSIYFGDHSQALVLRSVAGSFELIMLKERYMDQGMYGFIAFARGGSYNPLAGTTAKPLVALTQHA